MTVQQLKSKKTMVKELQSLLDELCIDSGFCLSPKDQQRLISADYYDADQFTYEVLKAEKMNPDLHKTLKRQIKHRFINRFGESANCSDFELRQDTFEKNSNE